MRDLDIWICSFIAAFVLFGGLVGIAAIDKGLAIVTTREIVIGIFYSIAWLIGVIKVADWLA